MHPNDPELLELLRRHNRYLERAYKENRTEEVEKLRIDSGRFFDIEFDQLNLNLSFSVFGDLYMESCYLPREAIDMEVHSGTMLKVGSRDTSFSGSTFSLFSFEQCGLAYAEFYESTLTRVSFKECRLTRTKLADTRMHEVLFDRCEFHGTVLSLDCLDRIRIVDPVTDGSVWVLDQTAKPVLIDDLEPYKDLLSGLRINQN